MGRYKQSLAQQAVSEYCAVAEEVSVTPTELALAWCYKQPHVASTIVGATSLAQLRENISAYSKICVITPEAEAKIESIYKRYRDPAKV